MISRGTFHVSRLPDIASRLPELLRYVVSRRRRIQNGASRPLPLTPSLLSAERSFATLGLVPYIQYSRLIS